MLGCLIEKQLATPDYYPMTLNALAAACNQKTSRDPVTAFADSDVERALERLREKKLAVLVHTAGSRVAKHRHRVDERFPELGRPQLALLAVLLLRGLQSAGELRSRTERLFHFADLEAVARGLEGLTAYEPWPLARSVPSGGGRHVTTWEELLTGESVLVGGVTGSGGPASSPAGVSGSGGDAASVHAELAALRGEVEALRREFEALRRDVYGEEEAGG